MNAKGSRTCMMCGTSFETSTGFDMCPSCMKSTSARAAAAQAPTEPPKSRRKWYLLATLAVCAAILAVRAPRIKEALALLYPPQAEQSDPAETCEANLWRISALIQEGKWPDDAALLCPLTDAPYMTRTEKDDLVVSCRNAGGHGRAVMRVSRNHPEPEIK